MSGVKKASEEEIGTDFIVTGRTVRDASHPPSGYAILWLQAKQYNFVYHQHKQRTSLLKWAIYGSAAGGHH